MEGAEAPATRLTRRVLRGPSVDNDQPLQQPQQQQQGTCGRRQPQGKGRAAGRGKKGAKALDGAEAGEEPFAKDIQLPNPPKSTASVVPCSAEAAVGRRVMVWWYDDDNHEEGKGSGSLYMGKIIGYDPQAGMHTLFYPDEAEPKDSDLTKDEIVLWNGSNPHAEDAIITWPGCSWRLEEDAPAAGGVAPGEVPGTEAAGGGQQAAEQPEAAAAAAAAAAAVAEGGLTKESSQELRTRRAGRGRRGSSGLEEEAETPRAAAAAAAAGRGSKRQRRGSAPSGEEMQLRLLVEEPPAGKAAEPAQPDAAIGAAPAPAAAAEPPTVEAAVPQQPPQEQPPVQQPVHSEGVSVRVAAGVAPPAEGEQCWDEVAQQAERGPAGVSEEAPAGAAAQPSDLFFVQLLPAPAAAAAAAAATAAAASPPASQEQPASQGPPSQTTQPEETVAAAGSLRPVTAPTLRAEPVAGALLQAPQRLGSAGEQAGRDESGSPDDEKPLASLAAAAGAGPARGKDARPKRVGKEKGPQAAAPVASPAAPPAKRERPAESHAAEPSAPPASVKPGSFGKGSRPMVQQKQQDGGGTGNELQELLALQEQLCSRTQKMAQALAEAGAFAREVKGVLQQLRAKGVTVEQLQATQQASAQEGGTKAGLGRAVAQVSKDVRKLAPPVAEALGDGMLGVVLPPGAREGHQQVEQVAEASKALVDDWRAMATGQAQQAGAGARAQQAQQVQQQSEQDATPRQKKKPRLSSQGTGGARLPSVAQKLFAAPHSQQQQGQVGSPSKLAAHLCPPLGSEPLPPPPLQQQQQQPQGGSPVKAVAVVKVEGTGEERGAEPKEEELFESTGNRDRDQALLILAAALASQRPTFRAAAELEEALFLKHPPLHQQQNQQQQRQGQGPAAAAGAGGGGGEGGAGSEAQCSVQYLKELKVLWEALSPQSPGLRPLLRYLLLSGELPPSQLVLGPPQEVQQAEARGMERLLAQQQRQQQQQPGDSSHQVGGISAVMDRLLPLTAAEPQAPPQAPPQSDQAQAQEGPGGSVLGPEQLVTAAQAVAAKLAEQFAAASGQPPPATADASDLLPPLPPPPVLSILPPGQHQREVVWLAAATASAPTGPQPPQPQAGALPPPVVPTVLAQTSHPPHPAVASLPNGGGSLPAAPEMPSAAAVVAVLAGPQRAAGEAAVGGPSTMDTS